jgi:hypothetical protein
MKKVTFILTCGLALLFQSGGGQPCERTTLFGQAFAASHLSQTPDHGGVIESKYDGFSHETVVTLRKMRVTCAGAKGNFKDVCVSFVVSAHCPGIKLNVVRYVSLQLIFVTKDWTGRHPLDERDLSVVADAETLRLGRMGLISQNGDDVMAETLEVTVPYHVFKKIALGQVVEMQVGKSRFELRDKNLAALRDLNNRLLQ